MATAEERIKILDMIREGKLSAEEGTRLLNALQAGAKRSAEKQQQNQRDPRWMRVRVTDLRTGKTQVSVNLPMSLINVGIKMGARFIPKESELDYASILDQIRSGRVGKIADMESEGERVEIWVE